MRSTIIGYRTYVTIVVGEFDTVHAYFQKYRKVQKLSDPCLNLWLITLERNPMAAGILAEIPIELVRICYTN